MRHAYGAARWEAAQVVRRGTAVRVIHMTEFLDEMLAARADPRQQDPRDRHLPRPCQIVRRGRVGGGSAAGAGGPGLLT